MDINFKLEDKTFNYRVACIIKNQDKILVEKKSDVNYLSLIGGRCKIGESSIDAIIREVKEETNYDTEHIKSLGMVENFFISKYNNQKYHEILIIHELALKEKEAYFQNEIINLEEKKNAKFIWVKLEDLKKKDFKPSIILDYLEKESNFHLINKD